MQIMQAFIIHGQTESAIPDTQTVQTRLFVVRQVVAQMLQDKTFTCTFAENSVHGFHVSDNGATSLTVGVLALMFGAPECPEVTATRPFVAQFRSNLISSCSVALRSAGTSPHVFFKGNTVVAGDPCGSAAALNAEGTPGGAQKSIIASVAGASDVVFKKNVVLHRVCRTHDDRASPRGVSVVLHGDASGIFDQNCFGITMSGKRRRSVTEASPKYSASRARGAAHGFYLFHLSNAARLWFRDNNVVVASKESQKHRVRCIVGVEDVRSGSGADVNGNHLLWDAAPGAQGSVAEWVRYLDDSSLLVGSLSAYNNHTARVTRAPVKPIARQLKHAQDGHSGASGSLCSISGLPGHEHLGGQAVGRKGAVDHFGGGAWISSKRAERWGADHALWQKSLCERVKRAFEEAARRPKQKKGNFRWERVGLFCQCCLFARAWPVASSPLKNFLSHSWWLNSLLLV